MIYKGETKGTHRSGIGITPPTIVHLVLPSYCDWAGSTESAFMSSQVQGFLRPDVKRSAYSLSSVHSACRERDQAFKYFFHLNKIPLPD